MFDPEQQENIEEKVGWLRELKEGKVSYKQLEQRVIDNSLEWFETNKRKIIRNINSKKFNTDLEKVHYLIFYQWLKNRGCNPKDNHSILYCGGKEPSPTRIIIYTKNFCSYLEAMKSESLNSKESCKICKDVLHTPIQRMIDLYLKEIGSKSKIEFSREYDCLRCSEPASDYCQEYLTLIKN